MRNSRFTKEERLRTSADFKSVFNAKKSFANQFLIMYVLRKEEEGRRIGFSVSKKIGNAVVRNKVRRRLREIYRTNKYRLNPGTDLIVIARPEIVKLDFEGIKRAFFALCHRANILTKNDQKYSS